MAAARRDSLAGVLVAAIVLQAALVLGRPQNHECGYAKVVKAVEKKVARAVKAAAENPSVQYEAATSSTPTTIRFAVDYQLSGTTTARQAIAKAMTNRALSILKKYIKIKNPLSVPLRTTHSPDCTAGDDTGATMPAQAKGSGYANTDMLFIVTASDTDPCDPNAAANGGGTLAFAGPCDFASGQLDGSGRPIIGTVNYCGFFFDQYEGGDIQGSLETVVHEMLHALGIGTTFKQLYPKNAAGKPALQSTSFRGGSKVPWLTTPLVSAVASSYFKCSSMPGAPLENGDGAGHFEHRLLPGEMMAPAGSFSKQVLSDFSLAALDDSGWYITRRQYAQTYPPSVAPSELGCDLVGLNCKQYKAKYPKQQFFCQRNAKDAASGCLPSLNQATTTSCTGYPGFTDAACGGTAGANIGYCTSSAAAAAAGGADQNGALPGTYVSFGYNFGEGHQCAKVTRGNGKTWGGCFDFRCDSSGLKLYELGMGNTMVGGTCPAGKSVQPLSFTDIYWQGDQKMSVTCPASCTPSSGAATCNPTICVNGWCDARSNKCICDLEWVGSKCDINVSTITNFDSLDTASG